MHDFKLWSEDAPQAYIQTDRCLDRELYIMNAPIEFGLKEDECLLGVKPIYSLGDSGDLWHATIDSHHWDDLPMVPLASDAGLYVDIEEHSLNGLSAMYADYMLWTGMETFRKSARQRSAGLIRRSMTPSR